MLDTLIPILKNLRTEILTLHLLGVSLGLGGTTIADLLFFRFLKDFRISAKEEEVLRFLSHVILLALDLLIISGLGLYLPDMAKFNASPTFLVKMVAVAVLTVNGMALHVFIIPHLIRLSLGPGQGSIGRKTMSPAWHRLAFALGAISITSWYTAFFIAMLKSLITFSFFTLLGLYLIVLMLAIIISQRVEAHLVRKACRRDAAPPFLMPE